MSKYKKTVYVNEFTNGVLNPEEEMRYRVTDGGTIVANTAPGCWGPMITPELKGGHEVTKPVFVENAEVGDAIAIKINSIRVTSNASASGNDEPVDGRFEGDPFVAGKCPNCGAKNPKTEVVGIGQTSIRCVECGEDVTPFKFTKAYSIVFDEKHNYGVTLNKEGAEKLAENPKEYMSTPENSIQNSILSFAPHDMVGTVARIIPFLGQLGTTPSLPFPDSHNAGDFAQFLIDAPHDLGMSVEQIEHRTDGHMDINRVREGAVLICPVKVEGGGVYIGDMHAMQGNGEIAGHTTDVSGIVDLSVNVIKDLNIDGPILLPIDDDLPTLAKPFTESELDNIKALQQEWKIEELEESLPLSFIGSGKDLNEATQNGMERAAKMLDVTVPEIMNRATITGSIDIGRNPGVVTVTFLTPLKYLSNDMLKSILTTQYK